MLQPDIIVQVRQLSHASDLPLPSYRSDQAAGLDLHAAVPAPQEIPPGEVAVIPTGIAIALPQGFEAQIRPRSGLAAQYRVTIANAPGTVDADYRGEIQAILINHGNEPFVVERGMRIAQLLVMPTPRVKWAIVEELPTSARGRQGLGHTGT